MAVWPTITDGVTRLGNALFTSIKAYIDDLVGGQGLPTGGATNDILYKTSSTNYAAAWTDSPTVDSVTLDTAAAEATGIAKIFWDATEGTVAFGMAGGVVTQEVGRNAFVRAKNVTASQINRGQVVYLTGAQGDRPTIELADATDESTSADTIGIAAEDIAVSAEGEICISGVLANVNTYGLTAGMLTYLSETPGTWTQTRPTQPAHGVRLGIPLKISNSPSGNSGVFFVQVNNGYEFEELHDVLITTATAGDIIKRNAGNTLWVNTAPAALTKTDDTNVTLTLGGSPTTALVNAASITAGWTGTLAASRLNSNVVQGVTNDTNVTGSITAQNLTLGWTGTLAAARLNSNVVQSVVNDTNVTGSISAQALTLGWTGQLALARGGTGASTQQGALNAIAGAVTSGSYLRGDGSNVTLAAIQAGDVPTLNQNTTGSAATLTTTRTLWGQNFNGSANVTGALSSVSDITMTGTLSLAAGTVTAPSVTFTGDTNTGVWSPGADLIAISTGGSERYRVGAAGQLLVAGAAGTSGQVLTSGGSSAAPSWTTIASTGPLHIAEGRLTLESGVPVSTTDQSAKTSVYYTPCCGNRIALYDGSATWNVRTFTEITISLAGLTASKPYDIFAYDNAGTVTIETLVWTSGTARATALVRQDGVLVKSGATTRRYLGTVYINATGGQTDDTLTKRYVYNYYNRVLRAMRRQETTDSWTYTTATARQANASSLNQLEIMNGFPEDQISVTLIAGAAQTNTGVALGVFIGEDSTTTVSSDHNRIPVQYGATSSITPIMAFLTKTPAVGYHYYAWLEYSQASGTTTWYGDAGGSIFWQSGITAFWRS